ncbi:uncharacterized protein BDV14DRAFT_167036 [Aspergillus stella-maris]|uniref:uncharacterized protein n=1 Tax=Aspergillus stella-maris TaxID=1810926 RepID=UPI003CCD0363
MQRYSITATSPSYGLTVLPTLMPAHAHARPEVGAALTLRFTPPSANANVLARESPSTLFYLLTGNGKLLVGILTGSVRVQVSGWFA